MKFLWQDLKRSFANPGFFAGFFGLLALLAYNFITESLHSGSPYFAIVNILAASGFTVFLPVFPVLGYASRFCGEYESGEAAAAQTVKVIDTVEPEAELAAKYEARYQQFKQIYPACRELFDKIV